MTSTFHLGDAAHFDLLAAPESLDCIVTDPPAGIGFMNASFDSDRGGRDRWIAWLAERLSAARRACKPGAYALIWALPRTSGWTHRALDDAGWTITDCITHLHGQGWPKNARTQLKPASEHWYLARNGGGGALQIDASRVARGASDWPEEGRTGGHSAKADAAKITGAPPGDGIRCPPLGSWPTNALLSHAPCCRERGTREVKASVNEHASAPRQGVMYGAHVERIGHDFSANGLETVAAFDCLAACSCGLTTLAPAGGQSPRCDCGEAMTWACPVAELDGQSGERKPGWFSAKSKRGMGYGGHETSDDTGAAVCIGDKGGASRFFPCFAYAAKSASSERHAGAEHLRWARDASTSLGWREVTPAEWGALPVSERGTGSIHPTMKSLKLARWLVRLLCPPGGRGGDPFCGSGSIGIAAQLEGFEWISSDLSPEAIRIAQTRMTHWQAVKEAEDKAAWDAAHPAQGNLFDLLGVP